MERTLRVAAVVALSVGLCLTAAAFAQDKQNQQGQQKGQPAQGGQKALDSQGFIRKVSEHNQTEIALGKLAAKQATNDEVKRFGQRMVDDHGKAGKELQELATGAKVQLSTDLDKEHQAKVDKFAQLRGAEFDRAYMAEMVKGHQEAVTLFEQQSKTGEGQVKAFASKLLPTLQQHLQMAKQIHGNLEKGGKDRDR
jgi:putative membrane protein